MHIVHNADELAACRAVFERDEDGAELLAYLRELGRQERSFVFDLNLLGRMPARGELDEEIELARNYAVHMLPDLGSRTAEKNFVVLTLGEHLSLVNGVQRYLALRRRRRGPLG